MEEHRDEKERRGMDLRSSHVDETRLGRRGSMFKCLLITRDRAGPTIRLELTQCMARGGGRYLHSFEHFDAT